MEFDEKFKTYSNSELLKIIENPNDYQPQAVETAKNIFSDRDLSESEIEIAKEELEIERREKLAKKELKSAVEDKIRGIGKSVFKQINPIQKEEPTSARTIKAISIFLGVLFLSQLYQEFGMLTYLFTSVTAIWDFSTVVLYLLPLAVLPTAAVLFYMRKKTGWILLTIFLTYSAVSAIGHLISVINRELSGIEALDILNPPISPIRPILSFLFFAGMVWIMSREKIRTVYLITKRTMILTVTITALIVLSGIVIIFY